MLESGLIETKICGHEDTETRMVAFETLKVILPAFKAICRDGSTDNLISCIREK
jgi:hypothetical protein